MAFHLLLPKTILEARPLPITIAVLVSCWSALQIMCLATVIDRVSKMVSHQLRIN